MIDEPLGGVGASNLIQAATVAFYKISAARSQTVPVYPEIYAFHFGRYWGSHAVYDFWPLRKEVLVKGQDASRVLEQVNQCGITCLAVPEGFSFSKPANVFERNAFKDRVRKVFEYSPTGAVTHANCSIEGIHPDTEYNFNQATETYEAILERYDRKTTPLSSNDKEYLAWLNERKGDVGPDVRANRRLERQRLRTLEGVLEAYRQTDPSFLLES